MNINHYLIMKVFFQKSSLLLTAMDANSLGELEQEPEREPAPAELDDDGADDVEDDSPAIVPVPPAPVPRAPLQRSLVDDFPRGVRIREGVVRMRIDTPEPEPAPAASAASSG